MPTPNAAAARPSVRPKREPALSGEMGWRGKEERTHGLPMMARQRGANAWTTHIQGPAIQQVWVRAKAPPYTSSVPAEHFIRAVRRMTLHVSSGEKKAKVPNFLRAAWKGVGMCARRAGKWW